MYELNILFLHATVYVPNICSQVHVFCFVGMKLMGFYILVREEEKGDGGGEEREVTTFVQSSFMHKLSK